MAQGISAVVPENENENNTLGESSDGRVVTVPESTEEALKLFKSELTCGQKFAQNKDFKKALDNFKVAFKYLPSKSSKYAGVCVASAASAEYHLGELRSAKRHAKQALNIFQGLQKREERLEKHINMVLQKVLEDLGEKEVAAVDLASLGL